jgi:hypothetical protein
MYDAIPLPAGRPSPDRARQHHRQPHHRDPAWLPLAVTAPDLSPRRPATLSEAPQPCSAPSTRHQQLTVTPTGSGAPPAPDASGRRQRATLSRIFIDQHTMIDLTATSTRPQVAQYDLNHLGSALSAPEKRAHRSGGCQPIIRSRAPAHRRSPNISMRMDWYRPLAEGVGELVEVCPGGRSTLTWWAMAGSRGLVSAPSAPELAGLLHRLQVRVPAVMAADRRPWRGPHGQASS